MRILILLGAATIAAGMLAAPAPAAGPGWPQSSFHDGRDDGHHGDRRDDRRRHDGNSGFFYDYYGGAWALYNNRSWDPDSYNDWWHDRTDRAYPRWVQEQRREGSCDPARMWWSGSGWHC